MCGGGGGCVCVRCEVVTWEVVIYARGGDVRGGVCMYVWTEARINDQVVVTGPDTAIHPYRLTYP